MRIFYYLTIFFMLLAVSGCPCGGYRNIKTSEGTLAVPSCCPMIKYSGTSISVKGAELPIPNAPVKIGEVTVEPKVLQTASEVVQILEQHRIFTCQMLPSYATVSKARFAKALDAMHKDEAALTQFALIVSTKNGEAIGKFVEVYGPQARRLRKSEKPGTVDIMMTKIPDQADSLDSITTVSLEELLK